MNIPYHHIDVGVTYKQPLAAPIQFSTFPSPFRFIRSSSSFSSFTPPPFHPSPSAPTFPYPLPTTKVPIDSSIIPSSCIPHPIRGTLPSPLTAPPYLSHRFLEPFQLFRYCVYPIYLASTDKTSKTD